MRLDIYGMFVVSVITPRGGWSKGRPVACIEETDSWRVCDLLIPNGLSDSELHRYVADKYSAFARPGCHIRRLDLVRPAACTAPGRVWLSRVLPGRTLDCAVVLARLESSALGRCDCSV